MKKILFVLIMASLFVGCSTFIEDYTEATTNVAEAIADNPVVETVATAYADKVMSAAEADVNPVEYYKDRIEDVKEMF